MRVYPGIRLNAFDDPAHREQLKIIDDALRDQTAALSRSVFPGTQPAANPVPSDPPPGGSPLPQPTTGDTLYGLITGSWAKLAIGTSGQIYSVVGGIPGWVAPLSLLPVHDHSNAAQGGNIPETSITDGSLLARLAANETITGNWTIGDGGTKFLKVDALNSGSYDGSGLLIFDGSTGFTTQIAPSLSLTADALITLPDENAVLIGTNEDALVSNKRLGSATVYQCTTTIGRFSASNVPHASQTNYMHFDLSAITGAKTKTWQNNSGTVYEGGGTDVVVGDGGTGVSSLTSNAVLLGGATVGSVGPGAASTVLRGTGGAPTFGTIDKGYIDDRTRTVWMPAMEWAAGSPISIIGTQPNVYTGHIMAGTADTYVNTTLVVPQDYVSPVAWKILYTNGGTSNSNTGWSFYWQVVSDGEAMTGASDGSFTSQTDAPGTTLDGLNIFTVGTTAASVTAGSVLRLTLLRLGSDSNTDDMYFVGLQFDYTADM